LKTSNWTESEESSGEVEIRVMMEGMVGEGEDFIRERDVSNTIEEPDARESQSVGGV